MRLRDLVPGPLRRLSTDTRGATAVEYGLILTLIVIAMIVSFKVLAGVTVGMWNDVSTKVVRAS